MIRVLVVNIGSHYFGAPIHEIHDVIQRQKTTPVPLAHDNIIGLLNLRGHIVTELDMARTLDIAQQDSQDIESQYSAVIHYKDELYSLVFDGIGDVIDIQPDSIEALPETVNAGWFSLSKGVYRMDDKLLVILDLNGLIEHVIAQSQAAA